ncbi:MAG: CDP-alcohol phosphatidyltransferase family protein [Actinomycetes bacterium]
MLQSSWREPVGKIIDPIARLLIKMRISANVISIIGGVGASISALYFFPKGDFLIGVIAVTIFALFDLFDGTVARLSAKGTSKWGAALDSTWDRISDSAILIGGFIYIQKNNNSLSTYFLIALVAGFLVSYIKARAESLAIKCDGGVAERTERLIIILAAYALFDLGVSSAIEFGIYLLSILSVITVAQRLAIVYKESK